MASALTDAHMLAKQRLMEIAAALVGSAWTRLPHYNQDQVAGFLATVLPPLAAINRQTVLLTEAYLARALGRSPIGVDAAQVLAGIRNGTTPEQVYRRPFVTVWSALAAGAGWEQAVKMGAERAMSAAQTDVQLSFTNTLADVGNADSQFTAYQRVADASACDFCQAADGQISSSGDLMPMHNRCGCGVEPISDQNPRLNAPERFPAAGGVEVAVRDHGELGPVLTNAADHFTGPPGP